MIIAKDSKKEKREKGRKEENTKIGETLDGLPFQFFFFFFQNKISKKCQNLIAKD